MAGKGRCPQNQPNSLYFSGQRSTGLPEYITREDICEFFSEFEADIQRIVIFRDKEKRSQGKGFITFISSEVATSALASHRNCQIGSVSVYLNYYVKKGGGKIVTRDGTAATQRGNKKSPQAGCSNAQKKQKPKSSQVEIFKLFVSSQSGLLPGTIKESDLAEHFRKIVHTPAHSVSFSRDPLNNQFCGFGYVEYRDQHTALEARVKVSGTKLCTEHTLYVQLESPLDHLEFTTLHCSEHESVYLRHYFRDKKTYTFNQQTVNIIEKNGSLIIGAHQNKLKPAESSIVGSLLGGLVHKLVTFCCDTVYVDLIKKEVHTVCKEPKITCIVQEKNISDKNTLEVFVFGYDSVCIEETAASIKKLKPQCKAFTLHPESPRVLNSLEQELQVIAQQHQTALKRIGPHLQAVRVYGLRLKDVDNTWKEVKSKVDNSTVTETVLLTPFQLKYLLDLHVACINEIKAVAEVVIPNPPRTGQKPILQQLNITAKLVDIIKLVNKLKRATSKCVHDQIQISCQKTHLLPWKKRWDKFVEHQSSQKGVYVEYWISESPSEDESDMCSVLFNVCSDTSGTVEKIKNTIVNVENGEAFTEYIVNTSLRETEYIQRNAFSVCTLLEKSHCVFLELQAFSSDCTVRILIASALDAVEIQNISHTLLKHIQDLTVKKLKFVDKVAGAILLRDGLSKIKEKCSQVTFTHHRRADSTVLEMHGFLVDVDAAETHIVDELSQIRYSIMETHQLILTKTSFPLLSSCIESLVTSVEGDQLLTCSYPTISHQEALIGVKCIQTVSGHILTIQLCDCDVSQQSIPDAVLHTKERVCTASEDIEKHIDSKCITVAYIPGLLDADTNTTSPKCDVYVHTSKFHNLSQALLAGLIEVHQKNYGILVITACHETSSQWLVGVLDSIGHYATLHPNTTIHTIQIALTASLIHTKIQFERYSFKSTNSNVSGTSKSMKKHAATKLRWYWKEHNEFIEYDQDANNQINAAWACDSQGGCQIIIDCQIYYIDFKSMTQTNTISQFSRCIQYIDQSSSESVPESQCTPVIQWSYLNDSDTFSCYTSEQSDYIEKMFSRERPVTTLSINKWEYAFDFERMVQVNIVTERERPIKREEPNKANDSISLKVLDPNQAVVFSLMGYPASIRSAKERISTKINSLIGCDEITVPPQLSVDAVFFDRVNAIVMKFKYIEHTVLDRDSATLMKVIQIKGEKKLIMKAKSKLQTEIIEYISSSSVPMDLVEYPLEWEPQEKSCQLFPVKQHSNEWNKIAPLCTKTMQNIKISKVCRIQNKVLWEKYQHDKKRICQKNNGTVNEKELFHGSRTTKAEDIVKCEDGLDMRWSAEGMWGRANYFAVNASYSDSYTYRRADGMKEVIVAKVLTGDSYFSPPDSSLRMPPKKSSSTSNDDLMLRYDTINGVTNGSRVYMTYSNEKAYPAYIITYCGAKSSSFVPHPPSIRSTNSTTKPRHRQSPVINPTPPMNMYNPSTTASSNPRLYRSPPVQSSFRNPSSTASAHRKLFSTPPGNPAPSPHPKSNSSSNPPAPAKDNGCALM